MASAARVRLYVVAGVGGVALLIGVAYAVADPVPGALAWIGLGIVPFYFVGLFLVRHRPDHPQVRRLMLVASTSAVGVAIEGVVNDVYRESGPGSWLALPNLVAQLNGAVGLVATAGLIAMFPDGVAEQRWQRRLLGGLWGLLLVPPLLLLASPTLVIDRWLLDPAPVVPSPVAVPWLAALGPPLASLTLGYYVALIGPAILLVRFVQAPPEQRARMRLVAATVAVAVVVIVGFSAMRWLGIPTGSGWDIAFGAASVAVMLMIPISLLVGVLRHRLFDIDLAIRRSAVFGMLWLGIVAIYVGLAALPGLALRRQIPVELAVLLTIAVAVAFQPVRRRLESWADRWAFGQRSNRYQLLASFGAALERTVDLDELLPRLAETVQLGLRARWVRVSLRGADPDSWLAQPQGVAGVPAGAAELTVALSQAGEVVGRIECGPADSGYGPAERELLATLAGQAATAIANVRLSTQLAERLDELARSRTRIVAAQDAERRRLERDIHDGAQQDVVALIAQLRLARNRLARGEGSVDSVFAELQTYARELLADLRELAKGIHPAVLSDSGVVVAAEARAARLPMAVTVEADQAVRARRFDADVEGAAYFVICEALSNVVKHAGATQTRIALATVDGHLAIDVVDDGSGLAARNGSGVGLVNLRDRVEALGGRLSVDAGAGSGTRVHAELPVTAGAPGG